MKFTKSLTPLFDEKVENMKCLMALDEENYNLMALDEDNQKLKANYEDLEQKLQMLEEIQEHSRSILLKVLNKRYIVELENPIVDM